MQDDELDYKSAFDALVRQADYLDDVADGDACGEIENEYVEDDIRQSSAIIRGLALEMMRLHNEIKKQIMKDNENEIRNSKNK